MTINEIDRLMLLASKGRLIRKHSIDVLFLKERGYLSWLENHARASDDRLSGVTDGCEKQLPATPLPPRIGALKLTSAELS
jgi:hypothetical protein